MNSRWKRDEPFEITEITVIPPYKIAGRRSLGTYSELVSEVPYQIDNSHSNVELDRGIKITKSVERQFKVDVEQSAKQSASGKFTASVPHVSVEFAGQVEAACRSLLSESVTKTHSVEDTVNVRVPPRTVCNLTIRWMRIWERGEIILVKNPELPVMPSGIIKILFEDPQELPEELIVPYHESIELVPNVVVA